MTKRWLTLLLCFFTLPGWADTRVLVAVASNFEPVAQALGKVFSHTHPDIKIAFSGAASGTHYHQILRGAPFDIFLSADRYYPSKLSALGKFGPQQDYAKGKLVLTSRKRFQYDTAMQNIASGNARLAIANPKMAPYGLAAQQVLDANGIKITTVQGQNVGQALNYLTAGAVDYAFASKSQVLPLDNIFWQPVPADHEPIFQAGILLTPDKSAALAFWQFLFSPEARQLIASMGYEAISNE